MPILCGTSCGPRAIIRSCTIKEKVESSIETSTVVPFPVRSLATKAVVIALYHIIPATTSETEVPTRVGLPFGSPVASINPDTA